MDDKHITAVPTRVVDETAVRHVEDGVGVSDSRRRLMRAGLAVAPVLMTLKSRSVLAADICIKPSAFSSVQANPNLSHRINQNYTCFSPGYWKNHDFPAPYTDKTKSYFLTPYPAGVGNVTAGFSPDVSGQFANKTMQAVLQMSGGGIIALARYTVATFLTAVAYGDNPSIVLLTQAQCHQMWSALAVGGTWSPFVGANWDLTETLAYFSYVYSSP